MIVLQCKGGLFLLYTIKGKDASPTYEHNSSKTVVKNIKQVNLILYCVFLWQKKISI
jgi:hypothetical protein